MWWKKEQPEVTISPAKLNEELASSWSKLVDHYNAMRARQGILWNRTNYLDLQNFFLSRHEELNQAFPREYGGLERSMVEEVVARLKRGQQPLVKPTSVDLSALNETEKKAACWKELLAVYCRIHGRLQMDLRIWNDEDFGEFETALVNLSKATTSKQRTATIEQ